MNTYTVGELASMAGITVRTLHHYDKIELLAPSNRTNAGYRLYNESDVDRLQMILTYRELGLSLEEVASAISDSTSIRATLRDAHRRISKRILRLQAISAGLERALQEQTNGGTMTPEQKLSVFGDFDPDEHIEEATQRWGDTDAYGESARRTSTYTTVEWETISRDLDDIHRRLLALGGAGIPPNSVEAGALVDEHRAHMTRWFYKCTPEIHKGLGQLYTEDDRFTENIDKAEDGLAAYLSEAIVARYA